MSPKAGAHGELCGLLCIRAALEARGDAREVVLVPESAHGTNPATAAFAGYRVENIPANKAGRVDLEALKARLGPDVAAVMITNPNTCGLFEPDMKAISDAVHAAGAFVYCDGANFNAIVGKVRPGDLGIDAMHINLHKTFSTPHGGGGPGAGPVVLSATRLRRSRRFRSSRSRATASSSSRKKRAGEHHAKSFGRMVAFHGQMGMFTRAASYMLEPWRGRPAPGRRGCGAQRQLRPALARGRARRAVRRERAVHARGAVLGSRLRRRAEHDRRRQGADRRGLPPDDHVFPAGRPWRDAGRADGDGVQGEPRPVHHGAALDRGAGKGR